VLLAGVLIAVGWAMKFRLNVNPFFNFQTYDPIPLQELVSFHRQRGDYAALISYAGLLVLICLPLFRVLFTAYLFVRQKEFALASIAGGVFLALILAMRLGVEL
jgi:uncharacterized membrane protein